MFYERFYHPGCTPYEKSYNAPEYADNHLTVELDFRQMIPGTRDLSVRVYSSEQVFMGADSIRFPSAKRIRRYKFDVCSPDKMQAQEPDTWFLRQKRLPLPKLVKTIT